VRSGVRVVSALDEEGEGAVVKEIFEVYGGGDSGCGRGQSANEYECDGRVCLKTAYARAKIDDSVGTGVCVAEDGARMNSFILVDLKRDRAWSLLCCGRLSSLACTAVGEGGWTMTATGGVGGYE
jgi:hypothetical protein